MELSKLYGNILRDLVEILNLFWFDREGFVERVLKLSDNDVSRLNIIVFDPLSPDTYIREVDAIRLQVVLSKRRWEARWGGRNRARFLVIGLNDDGSIYSHILASDDVSSRIASFGYSIDLYQLDELDDGSIAIPYDAPVRIQGDIVVTRSRPIRLGERSAIDDVLPCSDLDEELNRYSKLVKLTSLQRASIKISARHLCRRGAYPRLSIKSYFIENSIACNGLGEFYRVYLSWIGGARHVVEYFGCEPEHSFNTVRFAVLGKYISVLHPVHRPIKLRVNEGDVIEIRAIEQLPNLPDLRLNPIGLGSQESVEFSREVARILISRYGETKLLYYSVFEGVDKTLSRIDRYALRTILRFVINDGVREWIRRYVEAYRNTGLSMLSELPGYARGDEGDIRIMAYSTWIALGSYDYRSVVESYSDAVSRGYKRVSISIGDLARGGLRIRYGRTSNRSAIRIAILIARMCEELGKKCVFLCDEYVCPYMCINDRYCINLWPY